MTHNPPNHSAVPSAVTGLLTAGCLLASAAVATAGPGLLPAPRQIEPVALIGATLHTVSGGVIENGILLMEDGKITAIGTEVDFPDDTWQIDVSGKHVFPGLIDAHSQLGLHEIGAVSMTVDVEEFGRINPNVRAEVAFHPESRHIGTARSSGVLVAVSAPDGGLISGLSAAMQLEGWTWEEMILRRATGLIINWPSANNETTYERALRDLRDAFADARAYRAARQASDEDDSLRHEFDSRWEAMIPVLAGDVPVMVAADDVRQIQDAIVWAEEEDVRLILLGGRDALQVGEQLAARDIPVVLSSVLNSPARAWEPYDAVYSMPAKLREAGILFAIAGTSAAANVNRLSHEAGAAVAYGLPVEEALRAVTLNPARIFGIDDRVGSLEVGKDATLLITDGHPLEYATTVHHAFIAGREIDLNDAQRRFYHKYSEKVRQRAVR